MREFNEEKELTRPVVMRFATNYLTLMSIQECKSVLKRMFMSKEWSSKFFRKDAVDVEQ